MRSLGEAVRQGDARAVEALLADGADPDGLDDTDGVPVLCLAVAAYDDAVVEVLLNAGADRRTPLTWAVDGGSVGMVRALLYAPEPPEDPAVRAELLDRARRWTRTGTEAGLRRRTGSTAPVRRERVEDTAHSCHYEQLTLGGATVRDGHAGVLSELEECFGSRAPFDELCARALTRPDPDHAVWSASASVAAGPMDEETWAEALALARHPDRLRRLFAADVLLRMILGETRVEDGRVVLREPFAGRAPDLFPWAAEERDPEVLAAVLNALTQEESPQIEALGLSYRTHPDARVRVMALYALERGPDGLLVRDGNLAVVTELARDPDPAVRASVCGWLSDYPGRAPELADVLHELTYEDEQLVRIHAVKGLADRDDPRCVEAERRIGTVDVTGWPDTWLLDAVRRYEERRDRADSSRTSP
ncbi:ankyrin repeat domain-containing protein [Streptomyces sp. NPDC047072]|uniref:ankyrin repeat domain-containing protein n=1 Tax=Streptomyces sp. NPDC047072 TaxID=3154809 RepID=UPI0033E73618